ncbi:MULTISPECIES: NDMA-dependent alcohol dehydrogenase [unclassified Mycobacterium]|uniref:NDMA-dependent alcohol dehydrogenase n=1 Tax=unclassified Mycobacterium TaxID=2642494 RepID=UPI000490A1CF|nr:MULTISPECIES: NDMA-dependent alcohol dehydrogenase [unclassified Mycobacterium]SEA61633.1 S-(hydroxymethyl)glutathione dehydrogenase / alcohol dehydrogenase [Mycobacterium sp. 283mftsu]
MTKSKAAVVFDVPGKWQVVDVDVDEPRANEVLVRYVTAGLCHTDDHVTKGDLPFGHFPSCGGHEGAGVVEAVGPGVRGLEVGDHIVAAWIPGCGRCKWCAAGMQNLCDNGALMMAGTQMDGTYRMHHHGQDVAQMSMVSTFSQYSVIPEAAAVKIDRDIPLEVAAVVGCGVATGWGSAVNAAQVRPGDVTIVMGVGGIGINAVQGARHAGAARVIAVDPVPFKRQKAHEFGATDAVSDMAEAAELARESTNGQGADSAIICVGLVTPRDVGTALSAIRKAGTVVVTSMARFDANHISANLMELTFFQKRIQGALFGTMSPSSATPFLLGLYQRGQLKLDELVTRRYTLDEINLGYEEMHAGLNVRGVIDF